MQILVNAALSVSILALFAAGLSLLHMTGRFLNFAHAVPFLFAPYFASTFDGAFGLPFALAVLLAITCAMALYVVLEHAVFDTLRDRRATTLGSMLVSFGLVVIAQNTVAVFWGDEVQRLGSDEVSAGFHFLGARMTLAQLSILACGATCPLALTIALRFSRFGVQLRALADDPSLAETIGIDDRGIRHWCAAIAAGMAALAGLLVGYDAGFSPSMAMPVLFLSAAALIVGGLGTLAGAVVGAILVGVVQHGVIATLGGRWHELVIFVLLLAFLIFRPTGFFGRSIEARSV